MTASIARVRDLYTWMTAWRAELPEGREDLRELQERQREEFDAALAAHDAELLATHEPRIAAEALRNAARNMQVGIGDPWKPEDDAMLRRHWSARRAYLFGLADKLDPLPTDGGES